MDSKKDLEQKANSLRCQLLFCNINNNGRACVPQYYDYFRVMDSLDCLNNYVDESIKLCSEHEFGKSKNDRSKWSLDSNPNDLIAKAQVIESSYSLENNGNNFFIINLEDYFNLESLLANLEEIELTLVNPPIIQETSPPCKRVKTIDYDKKYSSSSGCTESNKVKDQFEPNKSISNRSSSFQTANQILVQQNAQKNGDKISSKKSLGGRSVRSNFVSPLADDDKPEKEKSIKKKVPEASEPTDERLKGLDSKIIELICSEIMDCKSNISWDDIAGLVLVKKTLREIIILPMLRPDLFTGLRGPPKGLLLFGPPGTGKTLIGKCVAAQSNATFFSISASSLTSKWVGEGEKMVRALFTVARVHAPAVIFIDEIDSLLTQRNETEHEASRRIKTEFLVQLDGVNSISTSDQERILLIGATNRPQELDEAARRRFVKRLYIPLPCREARKQIVISLLKHQSHTLEDDQIEKIADKTEGFSGSDMANLCREAAMGPIRTLSYEDIQLINSKDVRPVEEFDFYSAFELVRPTVSCKDLDQYVSWNKQFGSFQY